MSGDWPHQIRGVSEVIRHIEAGTRGVCLTSPTGGGKSRMMVKLTEWAIYDKDWPVAVYTPRKMLTKQLIDTFRSHKLPFGVMAADYEEECRLGEPVQICAPATIDARCFKKVRWQPHNAKLVLIDEIHLQKGEMIRRIIQHHLDHGAVIVTVTATPIGVSDMAAVLVVAGTNSELRKCGALLPAYVYGCEEIDTSKIKPKHGSGEFSYADIKAIWPAEIFGYVLPHYLELNPERKPSILFAPGVGESVWFAEQFCKAGYRWAHIDGEDCWLDGEFHKSSREVRDEILRLHRVGDVLGICNRFVLREGVDLPHLYHGILATPIGSMVSYVQVVGRILRACGGMDHVIIQDHGGCLDSETEVLTKRGWLGRLQIRDDDEVAGFDRSSGDISWQPILHRHDRDLEVGEKMFAASGRCVDIRVTGNHRMILKKRTCLSDSTAVWPRKFSFHRADQICNSKVRFKIPTAGDQMSTGVPITDDELRFIGWFVTDGCMAGKRRAVSIRQADHQPQIKELRACLVGCGLDFTERKLRPSHFPGSRPQTQFTIPKGTCKSRPRRGWIRLEKYLDKNLSPHLEQMTKRQFSVFLHAVHLGDGDKAKGRSSYRISTGNKTFANRLQSLCVRRGFSCNLAHDDGGLNRKYVLNIRKTAVVILHGAKAVGGQAAIQESDSIGPACANRVWCIANPLETLVIRRNGKVAIVGNSWYRHGSPNQDRDWAAYWSMPDHYASAVREERIRSKKEPEPIHCPKCQAIRIKGDTCHECGFRHTTNSRIVIQHNGKLKEMTGDIFKPRYTKRNPDTQDIWTECYYRTLQAPDRDNKTFREAVGLFVHENHYWPPRDLNFMPANEADWFRAIKDVPVHTLQGYKPKSQPIPEPALFH